MAETTTNRFDPEVPGIILVPGEFKDSKSIQEYAKTQEALSRIFNRMTGSDKQLTAEQ